MTGVKRREVGCELLSSGLYEACRGDSRRAWIAKAARYKKAEVANAQPPGVFFTEICKRKGSRAAARLHTSTQPWVSDCGARKATPAWRRRAVTTISDFRFK